MSNLFGSICLTDIPKEQIKKVMCKDGQERAFLNIYIGEKKEPQTFGNSTYTHYVSCAPKKEERKEGVNYFIGDLQTFQPANASVTPEQVDNAEPIEDDTDLPF